MLYTLTIGIIVLMVCADLGSVKSKHGSNFSVFGICWFVRVITRFRVEITSVLSGNFSSVKDAARSRSGS